MNEIGFHMQYLVPSGYPAADGRFYRELAPIVSAISGAEKKWTRVPKTALSVKLNEMRDGATFEIKKREDLVYINLFCVEPDKAPFIWRTVVLLYDRYNLGMPQMPQIENWIHSVSIPKWQTV